MHDPTTEPVLYDEFDHPTRTRVRQRNQCALARPGLSKDSGRRENTVSYVAGGFQPVVSARRDDSIYPTDIPERNDAIILLMSINAPLLTIDRVRPIFLEYQNQGLEARATTAVARARNSGPTHAAWGGASHLNQPDTLLP